MKDLSGTVAKSSIDSYNRAARAFTSTFMRFLEVLAEYLEQHSKYSPYREMAKWIKSGKGVELYPVQGNVTKELAFELHKANIPYIDINNNNAIIIKPNDLTAVQQLNRNVLVSKSCYYQDVDVKEMENVIARFDRIKNKELLKISCRNKEEMEVLKRKCNDISAGFMIGVDLLSEKKDNYDIVVHAAKVLRTKSERNDFCKAYLQMALSLYGPNSHVKLQQLQDDRIMDNKIALLKGTQEPAYLISTTDNRSYIEFNQEGFKYYVQSKNENGDKEIYESASCSISDEHYEIELQRYKDRIFNKQILTSEKELGEHLATKKVNISSDRTRKTKEQFEISVMESLLADKINDMIDKKIIEKEKERTFCLPNSKELFDYYRNECMKIMEALRDYDYDEIIVPNGYKESDMKVLLEEIEKRDIDFGEQYGYSMERMENVESISFKARPQDKEYVEYRRKMADVER